MMLILSDIIAVSAAFFLILLSRFGGAVGVVKHQWTTIIFLYVITLGIFYFTNLYEKKLYANKEKIFRKLVRNWLTIGAIYFLVGFSTRFSFLIDSRIFIILYGILSLLFFTVIRIFLVPKLLEIYYSKPQRKIACSYFGPERMFEKVKNFLREKPFVGIEPLFVGDDCGDLKDDYDDRKCDYSDKEIFL
jgi:FlaA1/EpsC-like NDP-sugar epimerase